MLRNEGDVSGALMEVITVLKESKLDRLLIEFETNPSQNNPTFKMLRQYMKMMAILLLLI